MNGSNKKVSRGSIQVPYGSKVYWKTDNPGYIEEKGVTQGESDETVDLNLVKLVEVGDIILSKGSDIILVRPSDLISTYQESGYTPVGIVVIPNSHNVYGDYSCGIVGLREYINIVWGTGNIDSSLINFSRFGSSACIGENGSVGDSIVKLSTSAKLPSTGFSSSDGPDSLDNLGKYFDNSSEYAPSPYNSDGSRNVLYSQIDPLSSISNNLAEFSGKFNTRTFADASKTGDDYRAVTSCASYSLSNLGEWYLPTVAELGYLCARLKEINESIQKIKEVFGDGTPTKTISGKEYWSSTIGDGDVPMCVNMEDGSIIKKDKSNSLSARPFFRAKEVSSINIVTLTINPTPSDATVVINGKIRNSMSVFSGSIVTYEVYKDNYVISSGNISAGTEDQSIDIILDPAPKVGDIALWNNNKIVFSSLDNLNQHASETPIGVVVIPSSHNVYENGCCCILGLGEENKEWGVNGAATSETSLKNYNNVVYIGSKGSLGDGSAGGVFDYGNGDLIYFSSDSLNVEASTGPVSLDGVGKYKYASSYYIPSPYNSDGTRNRVYDTIEAPSDSTNATHDFSGKGNTSMLSRLDGFNAAKWCVTYKTDGTNEGDWFIPGYGELGYIFSRYNVINASLSKINYIFSSTKPATILSQISYWSSTEYSNSKARYLNFYEGLASAKEKNDKSTVRPCYQFPVLKTFTLTINTSTGTIWINGEKRNTITVPAGTTVTYVVAVPGYKADIGTIPMYEDKTINPGGMSTSLEIGDYLLEEGGFLAYSDLTDEISFIKPFLIGVYAGDAGNTKRFVRVMTTDEFTGSTCAWYSETSTPSLQSGYPDGYPNGATLEESEVRGRTWGKKSTDWILNDSASFGWDASKPAAEFARSYGSTPAISSKYYWNLPAAGELELVRQNKTVIKNSVVKAGGYGASIDPSNTSIQLWVSTQATKEYAWAYRLKDGSLNMMGISNRSVFVLPMASY